MNQPNLFTHIHENNSESFETLCINQKSFSKQNKTLLDLLMSGMRISFHDAYLIHGISDIRRRAKDLTDVHKIELSKEFIPGTRNKVWFMDEKQIENNKSKL